MKSDNLEKRVSTKIKIKNFLGDTKLFLNRYLYPAAFLTATNGAYLWGADQILDYVSRKLESGDGLATAAAYLGLTAGLVVANIGPKIKDKHRGLFHVAKKIYDKNREEFKGMRKRLRKKPSERYSDKEKQSKQLDWFKTGIVTSAMIATYFAGGFPGVIERFNFDLNRMASGGKGFIQSFARKESLVHEPKKILEKDKGAEVTPKIRLPSQGPYQVPAYLQGKKINGDIYGAFTGIHGIASAEFSPDFNLQLAQMWDKKISWINDQIRKKNIKKFNPEVLKAKEKIISEYASMRTLTRMTLDDYVREADNSIDFINKNIDWEKVGEQRNLSESETELVKKIASSLTGKDLLAYGLTELMPSTTDGLKNKLVLDMLLRGAGREYVEFIPAMYDDRLSIGPYQMTSHAVYAVGDDAVGVSLINTALPEDKRIPNSVIMLKGNDHHKAAYMFAINNLAELVGKLNRVELSNLWNNYEKKEQDLVQFIATAHHLPTSAVQAAKKWLSHGCKYDFTASCSTAILGYAKKTAVNYAAMHTPTDFSTVARIELPPEIGGSVIAAQKSNANDSYTVTVRKDQTLYSIAKQNQVSLQKLKEWNKLPNNNLQLNKQLRIYRNK